MRAPRVDETVSEPVVEPRFGGVLITAIEWAFGAASRADFTSWARLEKRGYA